MQFSDTTNKNGILQRIEQYTGLGDGGITNDTTLIKVITAQVNEAFDEIMPLILASVGNQIQWDDINNTGNPIGYINIVSGQSDYLVSTDQYSLDILDIKAVRTLISATATTYADVQMIDSADSDALSALSPNTGEVGVPRKVLKRGNQLFAYPQPNYNATNGFELYFERIQSYFASTDTTKSPGIPRIFHSILPKIASYHWLTINKPSNTVLLQDLGERIKEDKAALHSFVRMRAPTRTVLTTRPIRFR